MPSLPNKKQKLPIMLIVMAPSSTQLYCLKLSIQSTAQLQQISQFLKSHSKIPYKNCIFTPKPAQKGQFTMQKTIKQIINQCKFHNGHYILLCYQSHLQGVGSPSVQQRNKGKSQRGDLTSQYRGKGNRSDRGMKNHFQNQYQQNNHDKKLNSQIHIESIGNDTKSMMQISARTEPNFSNIDRQKKQYDNIKLSQQSSRNQLKVPQSDRKHKDKRQKSKSPGKNKDCLIY